MNPQFHIIFDDQFLTINVLYESSKEIVEDEEMRLADE